MSAAETTFGGGAQSREPSNEELKSQLEQTRKDMRILASLARKRAVGAAQNLRDEAGHKVEELSEEASRLMGDVRDKGEHLYGEFEETVRRNPIAATGIAFAIGWVIGTALRK